MNISKEDFLYARRVFRDNGYYAFKWMSSEQARVMRALLDANDDPLDGFAWTKRVSCFPTVSAFLSYRTQVAAERAGRLARL